MNAPNDPEPASDGVSIETHRALSSALIGGAFGFTGIAIFASASYADKVEPSALGWGNILSMISVVMLMASIIFGGRGWTRKDGDALRNTFSLQALSGLLGVLLLCVAAGIFAFNPKIDRQNDLRRIEIRLDRLENQLGQPDRVSTCPNRNPANLSSQVSRNAAKPSAPI